MMEDEVAKALEEMIIRRMQRATVVSRSSGGTLRNEIVATMRGKMFSVRESGRAFDPLPDLELAFLEDIMNGYIAEKRLRVAAKEVSLGSDYGIIRHNRLSGRNAVKPDAFRSAASRITGALMSFVNMIYGIPRGTPILLPWRAGLAFGEAARNLGLENFYHLGARRNEKSLKTEIYFEEIPAVLRKDAPNRPSAAIIADPMLASEGTIITGIERLKEFGVPEEGIIIVSVISAPEGVDRILSTFPGVRIVTGNHDEHLDENAYIVPGLGDFGDLYCDGLGIEASRTWREMGVLNDNASRALIARMALAA